MVQGKVSAGLRHVISASQFDPLLVEDLFQRTRSMEALLEGRQLGPLGGRIMATIFYEPSTRTRLSFETAMLRLGGQVVGTENARDFSSAVKGETLEDTVRIVGGYADCIVLRHSEEGAAARAASVSPVPVINAGDGPGEHPTQALLDLYTISAELGRLHDLHVVLVGDLANGRTVHSLAHLLAMYPGMRLTLVAPGRVRMGGDLISSLRQRGVQVEHAEDLLHAVGGADVVYQTRIQTERLSEPWLEADAERQRFAITPAVMRALPAGAILMHPLPRVGEIDPEVDSDPRAAYFRQARNGVPVRMALLSRVLTA
ncbi:MAG TPA: aspartate carbamoyltransferase [Candidatus Nanopelagicaceae bacterium]|nr:aspartate carbamoyltransferase [Candidatus Nanopelagicaceae bacterium]